MTIAVIQCAAKKSCNAGYLCRSDGRPVYFVARPELAPPGSKYVYARPDDIAYNGNTWRDVLIAYNKSPGNNQSGLLPAWRLYQNKAYARLIDCLGTENVYILSAGWGLLPAEYLAPLYDITFSQSAERYKRRDKREAYNDLRLLKDHGDEPVVFFGGKDYIPLFCELTAQHDGRRIVFYNSRHAPPAPGCEVRRFPTSTRTNWHYECANAFLDAVSGVGSTQPFDFA